jgi:hypothetical protein
LFTFRYHAISLVAVFLALGIGILLGVTIGENGIVSDASKDLEKSLRGDLNRVRGENRDLKGQVSQREEYEKQSYPALVEDLLPGWRVGIVAMGKLDSDYTGSTANAVEPAGAKLDSVAVISSPLHLGRLSSELNGTHLARLDRSNDVLERFGRRIGRQLVGGGDLIQRVRHGLFSNSRGEFRGLDGIVYVRDRDGLEGDQKAAQDRFESALISAIKATGAGIVGVETTGTDDSQVGFMGGHGITSVDDLDLIAGKTALIYAFAGGKKGKFGVKGSAEALLPPAPEAGAPRSR